MKRLVLELELQDLTIFLVHLSLPFRVRHHQLTSLCRIVKGAKKPHIVAGDFNSFFGAHELELFRTAVGLTSADPEERPTFPSWAPKHQLDFILYSPGIKIKSFKVPDVDYSDHLPLVCDIEVENKKSHR